MAFYPTLGGVKNAQEFLRLHGFPMPFFLLNPFTRFPHESKQTRENFEESWRKMSLVNMIRQRGFMFQVHCARLADDDGRFVQIIGDLALMESSGAPGDPFYDFLESYRGSQVFNIMHWGKAEPTGRDWFMFRFQPAAYAYENFD